ncbi:hypothetical protein Palpr_2536 [Paludibacter propionicigenes WB4]|uniref:Uncharacterized protein n=1 Tax=Paludibacter propionicigenes (strain DSM 17365 / JCM 13257 / WB4) TaxID=694427 RepID=E4T7H4_PALPW|nr:hypothetical protein Palpr_2536 [Paludibacter propionicigenes WB4]
MPFNLNRRSNRLKGYDYAQEELYFMLPLRSAKFVFDKLYQGVATLWLYHWARI